jgi:hypothetical protein
MAASKSTATVAAAHLDRVMSQLIGSFGDVILMNRTPNSVASGRAPIV